MQIVATTSYCMQFSTPAEMCYTTVCCRHCVQKVGIELLMTNMIAIIFCGCLDEKKVRELKETKSTSVCIADNEVHGSV